MADQIPLNQPSRDQVLALINRDNGLNFTFQLIEFATPQYFGGDRNTSLEVTAIPGQGLTGSVTVTYNRLDLGLLFQDNPPAVVGNQVDTSTKLADLMNDTYGLMLEEEDIVVEPINGSTHLLKAAPGSYAWIGEVVVQIFAPNTPINTHVLYPHLDGYVYPPDESEPDV